MSTDLSDDDVYGPTKLSDAETRTLYVRLRPASEAPAKGRPTARRSRPKLARLSGRTRVWKCAIAMRTDPVKFLAQEDGEMYWTPNLEDAGVVLFPTRKAAKRQIVRSVKPKHRREFAVVRVAEELV